MARNLSVAALDQIAKDNAGAPITVVEIEWEKGTNTFIAYADTDIPGRAAGKILRMNELDSVIALSLNETSEEVEIVLDDTDGDLKQILNTTDIHLSRVNIYQWFQNLPWEDRFLVLPGKLNSPIRWSEADRTLTFTVMTHLEDVEIGFSPEEGNIPDLPDYLIGKAWPECFGKNIRGKSLRLDNRHSGSLGEGVGLVDFTIIHQIQASNDIRNYLVQLQIIYALAQGYYQFIGNTSAAEAARAKQQEFIAGQQQMIRQIDELQATLLAQQATVKSSFSVVNGETFPRGTLVLKMCGGLFKGSFSGNVFNVSEARHPDEKFYKTLNASGNDMKFPFEDSCKTKILPFAEAWTASSSIQGTLKVFTGQIGGDQGSEFFCQAGSQVEIYSAEPIRYVASITPGRVLGVSGWTTLPSGERVVTEVPSSFWRTYTLDLGTVQAVIVEVFDAVSKFSPGWEEDLYITFESDIGPNTVDIMRYLISRYSNLAYDVDSFNHVEDRLQNYPMNFCYDKKFPLIQALKELAYQNRTAVFVKNDTVFLKYVPDAPEVVHEFNEDNIDIGSVGLEFTPTEDLVTKQIIKWRSTDIQPDDNTYITRYNVKTYGDHEQSFDYYAFNKVDMVAKTAEFWAIRRGNVWKKAVFTSGLDALNVETFDGVVCEVCDPPVYADQEVIGVVEFADVDTENFGMTFEVWLPVRIGSMRPFEFGYTGVETDSTIVPGPKEGQPSDAFGSGGPGEQASGNLNTSGPSPNVSNTYTSPIPGDPGQDPYHFGGNRNNDRNSQDPTDPQDNDPGTPNTPNSGSITETDPTPGSTGSKGVPITRENYVTVIDIRTTEVSDSQTGNTTTFDTFFKEVTGNVLKGNTEATYSDGSNEGTFDYKWDSEDTEWGAGTAFLED